MGTEDGRADSLQPAFFGLALVRLGLYTGAMLPEVDKVLVSRRRIAARLDELAAAISDDLAPTGDGSPEITLVPILSGSFIFVADLIRRLPLPMQIHMISISSYRGAATQPGEARLDPALAGLPDRLDGLHVLVIDDILDSGVTLHLACQEVARRQPATLRTCVLLRKRRPRTLTTAVDYVAFDIPDEFVVGYGLDYNGYYRNLPDIGTLRPEVVPS